MLMLAVGGALLIVALVQVGGIPRRAHDDFGALGVTGVGARGRTKG